MAKTGDLANMDNVFKFQKKYTECIKSLHREGIVDEQFTQLQMRQDGNNRDFLQKFFTEFFADCLKHGNDMKTALEQQNVDFTQVKAEIEFFYGRCSSVGAVKVKNGLTELHKCCEAKDREGCLRCWGQVCRDFTVLNDKLHEIITVMGEIRKAGGIVPVVGGDN